MKTWLALKVAKAGYYSGNVEKVLRGRVDHIMAILDFESFYSDYEDAFLELNKE